MVACCPLSVSYNLTTGPVAGHLLRQGAPMTMGRIAIFSFEATDLFFISMLGDKELAAVSFTYPIIWAIEVQRLQREDQRLTERLRQAETIIEVQKKVSEMLGTLQSCQVDEVN